MPSLAIPLNTDLSNHLLKMPELAKSINTDLSKGFTVFQVAESMTARRFFGGPAPLCPVKFLPRETSLLLFVVHIAILS